MEYFVCQIGQGCETYMKEYSSDGVEGMISTIRQSYYAQLCKLDKDQAKNIKIEAVGAGLGG